MWSDHLLLKKLAAHWSAFPAQEQTCFPPWLRREGGPSSAVEYGLVSQQQVAPSPTADAKSQYNPFGVYE